MSLQKKIAVIDAMALAYKAYFAFSGRPLRSKSGEPTSAVFGFMTQLLKIFETVKPDMVMVAFDSKEKTFRHELFNEYKSNRQEMPEDMVPQIGRIKELIEAFSLPVLILPGYEADDIAGTIARKADQLGHETYLVTPDKDYFQLVTKGTKVYRASSKTDEPEVYDEEKVLEKFGFEPVRMIDYLALIGDTSDFVPGVLGIGDKTATPLIQQFGSVENIYENIENIKSNSVKQKLLNNKENAFLSKKLVTIDCDVPIKIDFEHSRLTLPDFDRIESLFTELDFKFMFNRTINIFNKVHIDSEEKIAERAIPEVNSFVKEKVDYRLITSEQEAKELADILSNSEMFVFDTETDSLNVFEVNLAGVAFSIKENTGFFVAVDPFIESNSLFALDLGNRLSVDTFISLFKPIFENSTIKKICQNGKYDIGVMRKYGVEVKNFYFDTMIAGYLIDTDQKLNMDSLSEKYLNYKPIPLSDLIGIKKDPKLIFEVDPSQLKDYSAEDADVTLKLYQKLSTELLSMGLTSLAYDVEFPLVEVLQRMEHNGICIDVAALKQMSRDLELLMLDYTQQIFELAGEQFNINSPLQLQKILFDKLGLKSGKKTKTGYSTDAQTLESLRGEHPIIDLIQDYRQVAKLKSTYTDSLPKMINPLTGRIHTSFNQTIAATGRLSSIEPNLQNIPIRTSMGKEIRKAFIACDDKHILLSLDYSQIELRIMASICGDEGLCSAFNKGEDVHKATAALVNNVTLDEVTSDMRRKAKEVNFGIMYGLGAFGLKTRLGITQGQAKEIIDTYNNTFKRVREYVELSIKSAKEKGYAETLLGRKRFLHNINSTNAVVRQSEERMAINMPIQGTAADMIKIAMVNVDKELRTGKWKTKMLLQVHDELLFEVPLSELEEITPVLKNLMESALPLNVPVIVESGFANNWLDAH